jgi:hypothetical protein
MNFSASSTDFLSDLCEKLLNFVSGESAQNKSRQLYTGGSELTTEWKR